MKKFLTSACAVLHYSHGSSTGPDPDNLPTEANTMKTTKDLNGGYTVTGHTKAGELVQYTVSKNGHGWSVDLVYGAGQYLDHLYATKAEAVEAIKNQG